MVSTTAVLARAQATYRGSFRGAYAPHRSRAKPLCRPSTAKSSASRTNPYDAPNPLTVRGPERAVLRVVPVSPTPLMAAGQSERRGLGHVRCARRWRGEAVVSGAFSGQPTSPSGYRPDVIEHSRTALCRLVVLFVPVSEFLTQQGREEQ